MKLARWTMIVVLGTAVCAAASTGIVLQVEQPPLAWGEPRLADKLETHLTRDASLRVSIPTENQIREAPFPSDRRDLDSLVNWGVEIGGHYLLAIDVSSERVERRKTFHLPLVFHRWETMGVIEGELRLVDLRAGALLLAEPFKIEEKAARIFQASMDDNRADPDINLSASAKVMLIDRMEELLSRRIVARLNRAIGGD